LKKTLQAPRMPAPVAGGDIPQAVDER